MPHKQDVRVSRSLSNTDVSVYLAIISNKSIETRLSNVGHKHCSIIIDTLCYEIVVTGRFITTTCSGLKINCG